MSVSRSITRRLAAAALRGALLGTTLALLAIGLVSAQPGSAPADPAMLAVAAADSPEPLPSVDAAPRMAWATPSR